MINNGGMGCLRTLCGWHLRLRITLGDAGTKNNPEGGGVTLGSLEEILWEGCITLATWRSPGCSYVTTSRLPYRRITREASLDEADNEYLNHRSKPQSYVLEDEHEY